MVTRIFSYHDIAVVQFICGIGLDKRCRQDISLTPSQDSPDRLLIGFRELYCRVKRDLSQQIQIVQNTIVYGKTHSSRRLLLEYDIGFTLVQTNANCIKLVFKEVSLFV